MPEESVLLYIAAMSHVVSTTIVVEREENGHIQRIQHPVYFVSEVLGESKVRYHQGRSCSEAAYIVVVRIASHLT